MPVTGKLISQAIMANFNAKTIKGRNAIDIADSVGLAVASHITAPNMLSFTCIGTAGPSGTALSTAVVGIEPAAMSGLMQSRASQVGFGEGGRDLSSFFSAISNGVCQVLSSMIAQGTFAGLAMGGGSAKLTNISAKGLMGLMKANFTSKKLTGRDITKIADCISYGIVTQLKAGATFTIAVTGIIAPVPPVGPVPVAGIPAIYSKIS